MYGFICSPVIFSLRVLCSPSLLRCSIHSNVNKGRRFVCPLSPAIHNDHFTYEIQMESWNLICVNLFISLMAHGCISFSTLAILINQIHFTEREKKKKRMLKCGFQYEKSLCFLLSSVLLLCIRRALIETHWVMATNGRFDVKKSSRKNSGIFCLSFTTRNFFCFVWNWNQFGLWVVIL